MRSIKYDLGINYDQSTCYEDKMEEGLQILIF